MGCSLTPHCMRRTIFTTIGFESFLHSVPPSVAVVPALSHDTNAVGSDLWYAELNVMYTGQEACVLFVTARARTTLAQISPAVWRILIHSVLFGLALSIAELLFNFYLVSLGYAADVVGLLSTVSRLAGTVLGVPIGLLIDRVGAQRALLLGLISYSIGWILLLLSRELWALLLTQFLVGAAYILAATAVIPLLAGVTRPEQRPALFGLNASATTVIGLLGNVIGGLLPSLAASVLASGPQDVAAYRLALVSVAALGVLAALPLLRALPSIVVTPDLAANEQPVARLPVRTLLRYALAGLLLGVGGGMILPFQNLFFRTVFGLNDATVGVVLAWCALGMGLGALLGAPVSKRLGLRRSAALLRACATPATLLMFAPALFPAVLGLFLRGMFVSASFPLNDALVMQATPAPQRGLATSLMSVLWSLGWACAAVLSGWLQLRWGFAPVLATATVAYLLSSLAIFTLRIDDRV